MANWTKSEVRRLIAVALEPVVQPAGFRFKKKTDAFVRPIEGGRQELGIALRDYNPRFDFSFNLCVRLEAAQEIVNRFSGSPPQYHDTTLTSVTHLEFLDLPAEPERGVVYQVESERQLSTLLPAICTMVRERVLPFFEEYRDLAALNRGLNPEGAEKIFKSAGPLDRRAFDSTYHPYRAMEGIAVAHLARDSRLNELIAAYRAQMDGGPPHDLQKYDAMVAYLCGG
jgi:hypothetical protein